jgi:mRNA interferase RelE/StbE
MTYRLVFKTEAKKEWDNLAATIREQFKKKLVERIGNPRIESARLSGMPDCYKIKLRTAGYRLVYQVRDKELVVSVVAVGKRERNTVYKSAVKRIW